MHTEKNIKTLSEANKNLSLLFPARHTTSIDFAEVEKVYARNVLSIESDTKTKKGSVMGYLTGIMYFAPSNLSGIEVCPLKSVGCAAACLFTAGRGKFYTTTRQRIVKTLAYHFDRTRYVNTIKKSIKSLETKAKNKGMTPVVRLNGTSDLPWEITTDVMQSFPTIQFYDYTKLPKRFFSKLPSNYHLTFSMSESNQSDALQVLQRGGNVAVVFRSELPATFEGFEVIKGDDTDLRFLDGNSDGQGYIIGLKAKGKSKKDTTGFVRDLDTESKAA